MILCLKGLSTGSKRVLPQHFVFSQVSIPKNYMATSMKNHSLSLIQGSPEAPATSENRHLLDLGAPTTLEKLQTLFWVGSARKEMFAGYFKFFFDYFKFSGEPC